MWNIADLYPSATFAWSMNGTGHFKVEQQLNICRQMHIKSEWQMQYHSLKRDLKLKVVEGFKNYWPLKCGTLFLRDMKHVPSVSYCIYAG